jgi:hypothetical protein
MRFKTELVKGKDLKPGELFSSLSDFYWQNRDPRSIGERVYIRTDVTLNKAQEEELIYRITIESGC